MCTEEPWSGASGAHAGAEDIEFATVQPDWIPGLTARSDSKLGEPYPYFVTWPTIETLPVDDRDLLALQEQPRTASQPAKRLATPFCQEYWSSLSPQERRSWMPSRRR